MSTEVRSLAEHPLATWHLSVMRDTETTQKDFRYHLDALGLLLAGEASRCLSYAAHTVQTPLAPSRAVRVEGELFLVPILRAALGMAHPFEQLLPFARTAHLGLKRNEETLEAETYYANFPESVAGAQVLVIDPMLATGGSAIAALERVEAAGGVVKAFVCCLAAPEGIAKLHAAYPGVPIVTAAVDDRLNESGYIVPGLGDAGDRRFGT